MKKDPIKREYPRYFLNKENFYNGIECAVILQKNDNFACFIKKGKIVETAERWKANNWIKTGLWREITEEELALIL